MRDRPWEWDYDDWGDPHWQPEPEELVEPALGELDEFESWPEEHYLTGEYGLFKRDEEGRR